MDTPPSTAGKETDYEDKSDEVAIQRRQALLTTDSPDKESDLFALVTDRSHSQSGNPASLATINEETRGLRGDPLHLASARGAGYSDGNWSKTTQSETVSQMTHEHQGRLAKQSE